MDPTQELQTLRQLNRLLTDEERETGSQARKRKVIHAIALAVLVAAFMLALMRTDLGGIVAAAVAAIAGACMGFALYSGLAARQWPAIKPHVNAQSVAARLEHLER